MKKILLLSVCALAFFSCSEDAIVEVENQTVNLTSEKAAFEPQAQFNAKSQGVYVGSIVSTDLQFHSKIKVNAGNNGSYTAVTFINGEKIKFEGANTSKALDNIEFVSAETNSSFTLDISDYQNPVATDVYLYDVASHLLLQKNDENNRADVLIGNYADVNDPNFFGTFDVFTEGTPHPYDDRASFVTRTSFVAPGGALFVDETMESFDFSVCTEDETQTDFIPLMYVNLPGTSAHFYADNQTSTVSTDELTWQVFHFLNDGYYIQFKDLPGFEDGCYETASGIWGWDGRYGVIAFDFFDGEPQGIAPQQATNKTLLANENAPMVLTQEIIQAVLEN